MDRFSVFISYPVKVEYYRDQNNGRGRGGYQGDNNNNNGRGTHGSFFVKKLGYNFPFKLDDYLPS